MKEESYFCVYNEIIKFYNNFISLTTCYSSLAQMTL